MPLLTITPELKKFAKEIIKVPHVNLGICPNCGGLRIRGGVCDDCAYEDPEEVESIKEWEAAQNATQKAASTSYYEDLTTPKDKKLTCPKGHPLDEFGIECKEPTCFFSKPPEQLDFHEPTFTGMSPDLEIKTKFLSPASKEIEKQKTKLKKKKTKKSSYQGPGTTLDDDSVASSDKVTRGQQALEETAKMQYFDKQKGEDPDEENKEQ